uniref:Uncharacterized protein n=1 Tax=Anguilla anguilla TaxID=7936 RepID=A0A0E9PN99_ANGAN
MQLKSELYLAFNDQGCLLESGCS